MLHALHIDEEQRMHQLVPIWVRDPTDPEGLRGSWREVDPREAELELRQACQASAVAMLWGETPRRAVA